MMNCGYLPSMSDSLVKVMGMLAASGGICCRWHSHIKSGVLHIRPMYSIYISIIYV